MFHEALFSHLRKRFSEFLYKILANTVYMRSLAYKLSQCLSANHNPELRCVICTGVTLFAPVLYFLTGVTLELHCSQPIKIEEIFSCVLLVLKQDSHCSLYCNRKKPSLIFHHTISDGP